MRLPLPSASSIRPHSSAAPRRHFCKTSFPNCLSYNYMLCQHWCFFFLSLKEKKKLEVTSCGCLQDSVKVSVFKPSPLTLITNGT